ncbi:lactate utilization protein C [Dechloromonas sp. ZS-1]|uniref:LutC/YkgG family protein n=1 Tax=Dechloromonas sp. ZS-1 TaxID=3138067 RepID=UPI0031FCA1E4
MSARDEILRQVRAGVAQGDAASRKAAVLAYLAARTAGPQPACGADLPRRFIDKAVSLASTVQQVSALADVPAAVAGYLRGLGLPCDAVMTADLAGLDWAAAGLTTAVRPAVDADRVGISGCFCAIAETGTLLLLSSPETPATVSLLPETHIAIVPVSRILDTMEAAFACVRAERVTLPRALNFISGPSRTGDIEQTIVLGAHGPCRVHLILVEQA